ncbi:DoxX family membrane protein [Streptomyces glaucescens]|uniref:NapU3 n=1 Tax=Streptomyces glaucescens TaxID=1907 RepID=A0A089YQX8_STRGA|nr:DoxX family membrane protein [Streptomyces glaucescens]AIR96065.1 NapU3 [Streptomyces glaucescens]
MHRAGERSRHLPRKSAPADTGSGGRITRAVASLTDRNQQWCSAALLRVCVGAVFLWFGVLKFFPAASPAEGVAIRTATKLTLGLLPPDVTLRLLAAAETVIGLGLLTGILLRVALIGFFIHMAGVFSALLLLPGEMWQGGVPVPTLEGQYIIKNVVLVAACLVVAADEWSRTPPPRGRPGCRSAAVRRAVARPEVPPPTRPPRSGGGAHADHAVRPAPSPGTPSPAGRPTGPHTEDEVS